MACTSLPHLERPQRLRPRQAGLPDCGEFGSLIEFAGRLRLGRAPWAESLRRLRATPRAAIGMTISHAALGVVVLGAVATGAWHVEVIQTLKPGEKTRIAGYDVMLVRVDNVQGPNYIAERAGPALDPDHDLLLDTAVVHTGEDALGEASGPIGALHAGKDTIAPVARLGDIFRNPFSFLFSRSSQEERLAAYVIREHDRGRSLDEILNDRYLINRTTPAQLAPSSPLWRLPRLKPSVAP